MFILKLLIKIPYSIAWRLSNASNYAFPIVFYCTDFVDYQVFEPIRRHLPELSIVAKNRKIQNMLFEKGISSILWPAYPKIVIMARNVLHLFPSRKILKIGIRCGAYNFIDFNNVAEYDGFDLFLFNSKKELERAKKLGITNGIVSGFPKMDDLHNKISSSELTNIKSKIGFDSNKKVILFTATPDKSGRSTINYWYNKLEQLTFHYNILVSVHPLSEKTLIAKIKDTPYVYFIENENISPFLMITDLLVGDTSSIIAEFCTLDRPIITFNELNKNLNLENIKLLSGISYEVDSFKSVVETIPIAFSDTRYHSIQRKEFNSVHLSNLDGNSGLRAANIIKDFVKNHGISF